MRFSFYHYFLKLKSFFHLLYHLDFKAEFLAPSFKKKLLYESFKNNYQEQQFVELLHGITCTSSQCHFVPISTAQMAQAVTLTQEQKHTKLL